MSQLFNPSLMDSFLLAATNFSPLDDNKDLVPTEKQEKAHTQRHTQRDTHRDTQKPFESEAFYPISSVVVVWLV